MRAHVSSSWLWLLVALQVAIPASYYLLRADREDERFAWRMFSAVRLQRCEVRAYELDARGTVQPIELSQVLHASWRGSLERGRRAVIERFLATRCERPGVVAAALERRCIGPAQAPPGQRTDFRFECSPASLTVRR